MKYPTGPGFQCRSVKARGLKPTAAAVVALAALSSQQAYAQATQTVQVSGIRAAIESAISSKKNADNIVEALNAEDIGKMPDATIAESISRLPGVTTQRDATGRAKNISVRGMSPDFNGAVLNGREMASTGDSRGVEFDQFPAELISSVLIHKTPNATLVGQGLSSTIDLRTVRPLDFNKRQIVANVKDLRTGVSNGGKEGTGDRRSFSYIDQFMDRKLGIAIGVAKSNDAGAATSNGGGNAWGRWDQDVPYNGGVVKGPAGFGEDVIQNTSSRTGTMAVLQFKPSKDFESTIDIFRSKGSFGTKKTGIEGALFCQPDPVTASQSSNCNNFPYDPRTTIDTTKPVTVTNGYLAAASLLGVKGVIRNHLEGGDDSLNAWGWNNKFRMGDWKANADIARSRVVRESSRFETTAGVPGKSTAAQVGGATYTGYVPGPAIFETGLKLTGIDYADRNVVKLTDVNGWSGGETFPQAGYAAQPKVTDTINSGRFSAYRDVSWGMLVGAEFGLNYTERDKVRTAPEGVLRIASGGPYAGATIPGSEVTLLPTLGISVASFDPRGTVGSIYTRVSKVDADILNKDWSVNERVTTGFFKGDIEGRLFGRAVTGNVGMQVVRTQQDTAGFNVDSSKCSDAATCASAANAYVISRGGTSYNDFNPSLNLSFDMGGDQRVRLGAARVMARPNMNDMRSSLSYGVSNGKVAGSAGNPELEPFRANALDLSYEKYFGTRGYISGAAFFKDLDSYILNTVQAYDFSRFSAALPAGVSPQGTITRPINGKGGNIRGLEFSVNLPFSMATNLLNGFGVLASMSVTNSSVTLPASGFKTADISTTNIPLPGLSKNVTNLRLYYENYGLQASLGVRKRSSFLGEISNFQDDRSLTYIKGDNVVDFQVSYEFQSGYLRGLSLLFQGNNLTNAKFERYRDNPDNLLGSIKYGKTYIMGVNYKF